MSILSKIVKSYAQALLSVVKGKSLAALIKTDADMRRVLSYTRFTALSEFLNSPYITKDDKFDIVEWVFGPKLVEEVHKLYSPEEGEEPLLQVDPKLTTIFAREDRVLREGQRPLTREFVVSPVRKTTFCFLQLLVDRGIIGFVEKIAYTYINLCCKMLHVEFVYISVPYDIPPGGGMFLKPEVVRKVDELLDVLLSFPWKGKSKIVNTFHHQFRFNLNLIAGCTVQINSTCFDCSVSGELGRLFKYLSFQDVSLDDYYG